MFHYFLSFFSVKMCSNKYNSFSLDTLTAQYFQQLDPIHLTLPDASTIVHPDLQTAIYEHMFNEATVWPLPPVGYRARALKLIISQIEEGIADPEEDVCPIYLSTMTAVQIQTSPKNAKTSSTQPN
jgi:hypothetical protein